MTIPKSKIISTLLTHKTPNEIVIKGRFWKKGNHRIMLPFLIQVPHHQINTGTVKSIYSAILMNQMCIEHLLHTKQQVEYVGIRGVKINRHGPHFKASSPWRWIILTNHRGMRHMRDMLRAGGSEGRRGHSKNRTRRFPGGDETWICWHG